MIVSNKIKSIAYRFKLISHAIYKRHVKWCVKQGKLPRCYINYLRRKEDAINATHCHTSFIFFSDIHWGSNDKLTPLIVKHLVDHTDICRVFSGGDVITHSDENKKKMFSLWEDFNTKFKFANPHFYQIRGNHDDNSYQQKNKNAIFSREDIILKQTVGDALRFGKGYSFYVDDEACKTRYLCLDTGKQYLEDEDYFDVSEILKHTPFTWHIVVVTHLIVEWIDLKYQCRAYIQQLLALLDLHNTKKESKIEMILAGHVHNDYYTTTEGGIPIVTVGSDAYGVACGKYKHSLNHYDEQCVTVIQLDYGHKKCYGTRVGRGEDFCYPLFTE